MLAAHNLSHHAVMYEQLVTAGSVTEGRAAIPDADCATTEGCKAEPACIAVPQNDWEAPLSECSSIIDASSAEAAVRPDRDSRVQ